MNSRLSFARDQLTQIADRMAKLDATMSAEQQQREEIEARKAKLTLAQKKTLSEVDELRSQMDEIKAQDGGFSDELNALKRELTQCQRNIDRLQKEIGTDVC